MTIDRRNKLNNLLRKWPKSTVAVNEWLHSLGVSDQLKQSYIHHNWVVPIGSGAVIRSGDIIKLEGAIYALQNQLNMPIHIGGRSALGLYGLSHYISFSDKSTNIFIRRGTKIPSWFKKNNWDQVTIKYHATEFLATNSGLEPFKINDEFTIEISSPERAILECLYLVPTHQDIEEAYYIMQGLNTLRPIVMQALLASCKSIKVNRLFLFLAEKTSQPWLKYIDISKINLGKGTRQIVKGGYLDNKYNITLPLSLKNAK
jgi:hypothetical protein